nr:hypothetical protein [uncultured Flavobacterium sp.]
MDIRKVSLIAGGDKGVEVSYLKQEEKKGRTFTNEVKEKRKYPIHNDLDQLFKDLRFYLLHITGIIRDDMKKEMIDYEESDCVVNAIKIDGTEFSIIGEKRAVHGGYFKIESPKIDQHSEYPNFDQVFEIIKSIKEETRLYMNGTKMITVEEATIRQIEAGRCKEMTPENFSQFSAEEQKAWCTEYLEKKWGSFVQHQEDIELEDDVKSVEHDLTNF